MVEILVVVLVVGVVAAGVMFAVGTASRGRRRSGDEVRPDRDQRTDTDVRPPVHPDRPVPGSRTDRARKGVTGDDGPPSPVS